MPGNAEEAPPRKNPGLAVLSKGVSMSNNDSASVPGQHPFQTYANGFGVTAKEKEYVLEIPPYPYDPDAQRIVIQTFCRPVALGFLQLSFDVRRQAVMALLTEIRSMTDQTARFTVGNGCTARIVQQSWFVGTVIVISSY